MMDEEEEVEAVLEEGLVADMELLAGHIYYTCCWRVETRTSEMTCPRIPCTGTWSSNLDQNRESSLQVVHLRDLHSSCHGDTEADDDEKDLTGRKYLENQTVPSSETGLQVDSDTEEDGKCHHCQGDWGQ